MTMKAKWTITERELRAQIFKDFEVITTDGIRAWLFCNYHWVQGDITESHYQDAEAILNEMQGEAPDSDDTISQLIYTFLHSDPLNKVYQNQNDIYVRFRDPDTQELYLVKPNSTLFKRYITRLHNKLKEKTITERMLRKAIINIEGQDAERIELEQRLAKRNGTFYFDLSNIRGEVTKITPVGWEVEIPEKPLFMSIDHHLPAFVPEMTSNPLEWFNRLWNYLNYDNNFTLLHKITFLYSFCPITPQPISIIHGEHGSAKSYFTKVWKRFVDPSVGENHTLKKDKELTHILGASWFVPFDNVSGISQSQSDILCQASTGGTSAQRKLYTDGETYNQDLKSVVVINGINISPQQPDLLRRCVLFHFDHISASKRMSEQQIEEEIELIGTKVLGSIFTFISKAMTFVTKYKDMKNKPIMADFAIWGCALAEAIGERPEDFLHEYARNRAIQSEQVANADEFSMTVLDYLQELPFTDGTEAITKDELIKIVMSRIDNELVIRDKYFPKTKTAITRKMERLRPTLRELGYLFQDKRMMVYGQQHRCFVFFKTEHQQKLVETTEE